MHTIKYKESEHLSIIQDWLIQRQMNPSHADNLPVTGFVTYEDGEPVAAAFIRKCEGNFAILDNMITNPEQPPAVRDAAIDEVVKEVIERSKQLGLSALLAWSRDENTLVRSIKHGFVKSPHAIIALDLIPKASARH